MELPDHHRFRYSSIEQRPDFTWPEGKRLALHLSINIEYFGYGAGTGLSYSPGYPHPNTYNWAWREYGIRVGVWRLLQLYRDYEIPITALVNSELCRHAPVIVEALLAENAEIVGHGRTNSEHQNDFDETGEAALIAEATGVLTGVTGRAPRGWLSPGVNPSPVTTDLVREAGYDYILDWPLDDQPVWMATRGGDHILSVPYPHEINDIPFEAGHDGGPAEFADAIIDNLDEQLAQSAAQPLVCGISLHPFLSGQPYRIRHLRRALDHIREHRDEIWIATTGQIADHFASVVPAPAGAA